MAKERRKRRITYKAIAELIRERYHEGVYVERGVPSERTLAEELGVARMTARRALNFLVDDGFLVRGTNRRLSFNKKMEKKAFRVALVMPAVGSANFDRWYYELSIAATPKKVNVRPVFYSGWDDIVLHPTLESYDGIFLFSVPKEMPKWLREKFREHSCPVVSLETDLTALGIPSISLFPPLYVNLLLDHLLDLGHRRVDCLNVQRHDAIIDARIEQWRLWKKIHGIAGELLESEYCSHSPSRPGRELMAKRLADKQTETTAYFCTTMPVAIGATRAIADCRENIGEMISLCVVDGEGQAEYFSPSITCLSRASTAPYLSMCLEWMMGGDDWEGSLLIEASGIKLFMGESTGPAPKFTN